MNKYIALMDEDEKCYGMTDNLTDMLLWSERVSKTIRVELFFRFFDEEDIEDFDKVYAWYNIENLERELTTMHQ